jgi:hypothetical protein
MPRRAASPEAASPEWLFVWRDLGEVFYNFDLDKVGPRNTLWLPLRGAAEAGADPSEAVLEAVRRGRPQAIALLPGTGSHRNPKLSVIEACRRSGIPTVLIVPDQRKRYWQNVVATAAAGFDLVVSLDGCRIDTLPTLKDLGPRYLRGWTPIAELPEPADPDRPHLVNMVGSLWGARREAVERLRVAGMEVLTRPTEAEPGGLDASLPAHKTLSCASYYALLRRSRIAVNFSAASTGDGHQLKGRVFEAAACGALLLESANDVTSAFFTPDAEFVYFDGPDDLVAKVRFYRDHPVQAAAIAERARERFLRQYRARRFWELVLALARDNNRAAAGRRPL